MTKDGEDAEDQAEGELRFASPLPVVVAMTTTSAATTKTPISPKGWSA